MQKLNSAFFILILTILPFIIIGQEPNYLSNAEIFKIMEKSTTHYNIKSINSLKDITSNEFGKILYPPLTTHIEYPKVIEIDSSLYLQSFSFDSLAWQEVLNGEEYYKEKDYKNALKYYEKAMSISESLYVGYLNAGDCYLMQDSLSMALDYYKKAYNINPYDYRTSFYQGTVYLKMQDIEKAKENYINALVLKPRHQNLMNVLTALSTKLNIKVNSQTFEPKALVRYEGDSVAVYFDLNNDSYWMAYAFAKAIWLGEKDIRLKISNSIDDNWNSHAENQAIFSLVEHYYNMIEENKIEHNWYLDQILDIMKEGYLSEFGIYEIASKINPDIVLQMPKDFRERIKEYVKKYVIIDSD